MRSFALPNDNGIKPDSRTIRWSGQAMNWPTSSFRTGLLIKEFTLAAQSFLK
jgi:hypothetical protein